MANEDTTRRDVLQTLGTLSVMALLTSPRPATAQAPAGVPGRVDTKGLTAPDTSPISTTSTSCA